MPTTFKVFSLGVQADLDTVEGNSVAENANALVGLTIGSAAAPLYNEIQTLSPGTAGFSGGNNLAYDTDNLVTNDEFRIDGGPDQIFDARGRYFVTLNYSDGTNDSLIVEIFQDTAGNTYLAPAENPGSSQSELEAKPIESIDILTLVSDSGGLDADRVDGTYATPPVTIDGTGGDDVINVGYVDVDGDVVDDSGNIILAGDGADTVTAGTGDDTIFAGVGNDTVAASDGNDTIFGGDGADTISHRFDADSVAGGAGDDFIANVNQTSAAEITTIDGGAGTDTYALDGSVGFFNVGHVVDLSIGRVTWAGDNRDVLSSIENVTIIDAASGVVGDANTNIITATGNFDNSLSGEGGNDTIFAGDGNDSVFGGSGNDLLRVGLGNNIAYGGIGDDDLRSSTGNDTLFGDAGNDYFEGRGGADTVYGGAGSDTFDTYSSAVTDRSTFFGGTGNDLFFGRGGGDDVYGGDDLDYIEGAGGDDTLRGEAGNDDIYAGDGNDIVQGGDGADNLFGDAGADTLEGGAGNDTLTGGAGDDTFIFGRDGSADIVTDFDIADTDADGFTNDQLDVSALRDLDGNPVKVSDVTVVNDGGFARLNFPEGESILLQGVPVASMSTPAQLMSAGIPCFTAGTPILTPRGPIPVEVLRPGDLVMTRDNGLQPIIWAGQRRLGRKDLLAMPKLRPVHVAPGTFGNEDPVLFSPQHGLLLQDRVEQGGETFVRARHLARIKGGKVRVAHGVGAVTYVHLMFEAHQVIMSGGIWSESFYPGPQALASLRPAELDELTTLFPVLGQPCADASYGQQARDFAAFRTLAPHLSALSAVAG